MVCYATTVMVNKMGFTGMKLMCPGFFLEGPHGNAEWESRENGPPSNKAIQKVLCGSSSFPKATGLRIWWPRA